VLAVSRTGVAEGVPRARTEMEERVENAQPANPVPAGPLVRHRLVDTYLEPDAMLRVDGLRLVVLTTRPGDVHVAADRRDELRDPPVGRQVRRVLTRAMELALIAQVLRHCGDQAHVELGERGTRSLVERIDELHRRCEVPCLRVDVLDRAAMLLGPRLVRELDF